MTVIELKDVIDRAIKEGKGNYTVVSYNGDYNYSSYGKNKTFDEAEIDINDNLKYFDVSVGG